ncbi:MAG: LamG domain-containing protein, partial [Candidatus Aenigmarchaeota archaeon]|nr:LamG domain-containing protein [Candidatus Aenigmarchaeota archaeon]
NASYNAGLYRLETNYTNLADGTYDYTAYTQDLAGNLNNTETRTVTIDTVNPNIYFVPPTPTNDTSTANTSIQINVSITEANLDEVKFNWNGTNYTIFNDSLILMMNFDNVSALGENDTYVVDISGSGNNGTAYGGTVLNLTGGKFGGAFEFDGVDDYLDIDTNWANLTSETYSAWIYPTNGSRTLMRIFYKANNPYTTYTPVISVQNSTGNARSIIVEQETNSDYARWDSEENVITYNAWNHVVVTFDKNNLSKNDISIYVNGRNLSITVDDPAIGNNISNDDGYKLYLSYDPGFPGLYKFEGKIDEPRVWNRTLSASEIQQLYFTNLNKYDTDKWLLYVNQSKNSTDGLDDGVYTYFASAKDDTGNENQTYMRTLTVDTIYPTITITSPENQTYNTNSIWFNVTLNETGSWCGYSLDGAANVTMDGSGTTWYKENSTMTEGSHNVIFSCNDTTGNMNASAITEYFTVDTTKLSLTDTSDSQTAYANYTLFKANYTYGSNSINGSGTWCEFRFNKTGLTWDKYSAVNMSFNSSSGLYEIIADGGYIQNATETHIDGMPYGNYSWNVSCYNDLGYGNLSVIDAIEVSLYSTDLAIEN